MVVQEIQMSPGKPIDLCQRRIDPLGIKGTTAFKKCVLIAEIAMMRTTPRNHDRVGHQVTFAFDQIAAYRRYIRDIPLGVSINSPRTPFPKILQKPRPRIFSRSDEDRIRMNLRLIRQTRDMKPAQTYIRTFTAVMIGD